MKRALFTLLFLMPFTVNAAQVSTPQLQRPLTPAARAFPILAAVTESASLHKVNPGQPLEMLQQIAAHESQMSAQEFSESILNVTRAWEADSAGWAIDDVDGAQEYFEVLLDQRYQDSERGPREKETFEKGLATVKSGFAILRKETNLSYGVAPIGAVQCGVQFPALLIMDETTGDVFEFEMEPSGGC